MVKDLILLFKIPMCTRKKFFEIYKKTWVQALKKVRHPCFRILPLPAGFQHGLAADAAAVNTSTECVLNCRQISQGPSLLPKYHKVSRHGRNYSVIFALRRVWPPLKSLPPKSRMLKQNCL